MSIITQKAYAKLNFNLHVLPKLLPNGYHQIKCLNLEANLFDIVTLEETNQGIVLTCNKSNLTIDETNLAYKAAKLVMDKYHPQKGVNIHIEKHIPITGGLGGGSADGAAVISGLNKLWKLNLNDKEKNDLAKKLGMDVCYSMVGGVCLATGAGEIVDSLNISIPGINLIIVSPKTQKPSTAWVYKLLDAVTTGQYLQKLDKIIEAIKERDLTNVVINLHNDFEEAVFREFSEVAKIKAKMLQNNALGAILAGSGLSVFGIWENQKSAKVAFKNLKKSYPQTFLTKTI